METKEITDTLENIVSNGREQDHEPTLATPSNKKTVTPDLGKPEDLEIDRDREPKKLNLPPAIENRYVNVDGNLFDRERGSKIPDIKDKGSALVTKNNDKQTAQDMVSLAQAKGWDSIRVKGSGEFRRQVWLEASLQGLEVKGYRPREEDLALLKAASPDREVNSIDKDATRKPAATLSPADNAKVAAAEKVLLEALKGIPEQQRKDLLNRLSEALKDPANVQKLPDPKREARPQPQRGQNRERQI